MHSAQNASSVAATLLQLGPVEAEPTFGIVVVLSDQRESLTAGVRAVIDRWTGSGILLVVTHGANMALTGITPASVEIVVVRSGSGGGSERLTGFDAGWYSPIVGSQPLSRVVDWRTTFHPGHQILWPPRKT